MHVKRYHAQNVQDALRAVRQDLGPEALVLSTRLVAAHGPRGWFGGRIVELTAAADRTYVTETRQVPAVGPDGTWPDRAAHRMAQRLTAAEASGRGGFSGRSSSPERRRLEALAALSRHAAGDRDHAPIEVFIGAPGSGKTTVVAGIAARERVHAGARFALVSMHARTDRPHDDVALHAGVVGAPFARACSAYELQTVLETTGVPLLVDVDSRGPAIDDVLRLVGTRPDVRVHLVIAADAAPDSMREVCERFSRARAARMVVTRVDLAASADAVVTLLRRLRLPVSYVCGGPRVPEDLLPMTSWGGRVRWCS
jgi:flagellar biosynthesis GTPase FlhF